jgi:class 3 adenylate cyclase
MLGRNPYQYQGIVSELLKRHLAAVVFTDMTGYTALMQRDEAAALRSRTRHREALEQCVTAHEGHVLQYFGDGSLSIFTSSVEAVRSAVDLQRELQGDPLLRVGIHSGDIAYDAQGAYGDAVNIAARLEAICVPGGITISQKIYDDIRRHPQLSVVPSGTVRLKNVHNAIPTFALAMEGLVLPETTDSPPASAREELEVGPHSLPAPVTERLREIAQRGHHGYPGPAGISGRIPLVGRSAEVERLEIVTNLVLTQ